MDDSHISLALDGYQGIPTPILFIQEMGTCIPERTIEAHLCNENLKAYQLRIKKDLLVEWRLRAVDRLLKKIQHANRKKNTWRTWRHAARMKILGRKQRRQRRFLDLWKLKLVETRIGEGEKVLRQRRMRRIFALMCERAKGMHVLNQSAMKHERMRLCRWVIGTVRGLPDSGQGGCRTSTPSSN